MILFTCNLNDPDRNIHGICEMSSKVHTQEKALPFMGSNTISMFLFNMMPTSEIKLTDGHSHGSIFDFFLVSS